jgi:hypothetical protein
LTINISDQASPFDQTISKIVKMHKKWFKIVGLMFKAGCQHFHAQNCSNDTLVKAVNVHVQ